MEIPDIVFATLPQFLQAVIAYPNIAWIYRGQADINRKLIPKAGRPEYFLSEIDKPQFKDRAPRDILRFNHWRELAIAYHKQLPENDFECLAFAQHYGLATRLLDWSTNPLAALFFAVDSCSPSDGVVYAYSPPTVIQASVARLGHVTCVAQLIPPPFDVRILLQNGVFTYHPEPNVALEVDSVQDLGPLTPEHGKNLVRLIVPADMKAILKRHLDEIGVNRKSLFPDLEGLSDYVNWETRRAAVRSY